MMDLSADFNQVGYKAAKKSDYVLAIETYAGGGTVYQTYDFMTRNMFLRTGSSEGGVTLLPFSALDRDVLEMLRNCLIDLGGKPPGLPAVSSEPKLLGKKSLLNP